VTSERRNRSRNTDDYADVMEVFETLRTAVPESAEVVRQRDMIIRRCTSLADRIARHYGGRGQDIEDLTQVARLGLIKAVNRFDPAKGSDFVAYAVPTMMGEVRRHFRDTGWSMHVPRRLKDRHGEVITATVEMTQVLGRAPTAGQVGEHLGLSREDIVESMLAAQAYSTHSIDVPICNDASARQMVSDTVGDRDPGFDRMIDLESVRPLIAALSQREQTVLYLRFLASMTQSDIATEIGGPRSTSPRGLAWLLGAQVVGRRIVAALVGVVGRAWRVLVSVFTRFVLVDSAATGHVLLLGVVCVQVDCPRRPSPNSCPPSIAMHLLQWHSRSKAGRRGSTSRPAIRSGVAGAGARRGGSPRDERRVMETCA
jgi:RNA polymerase sigma-B factor